MFTLNREQFNELLASHQSPCISLYMPTARQFPATEESPLRYRSLLQKVERNLAGNYPHFDTSDVMGRLRRLNDGRAFWGHQLEGLAIFDSPDYFRLVHLPRQVPEMVVVADSFHTKPLIRLLQSSDRFQVLCLSQHEVRLFEGDRYDLREVEMKNVPRSDLNLIAAERPQHGNNRATSGAGAGAPGAKGGYQAGKGQEGTEIEPFARAVDAAVWEQYSRRNGLPLILCGEPEYHPIFRRISRNTNLLPDGIKLNPHRLPPERLREEAWKVLEPHFRERVDRIIDVYHAAHVRRLASDDLPAVSEAVAVGKVGTLLVDEDRHIPAKFDRITGRVEPAPPGGANDLLDELAETVLMRDGQVLVLPHAQMPTQSGVAAIYRY